MARFIEIRNAKKRGNSMASAKTRIINMDDISAVEPMGDSEYGVGTRIIMKNGDAYEMTTRFDRMKDVFLGKPLTIRNYRTDTEREDMTEDNGDDD